MSELAIRSYPSEFSHVLALFPIIISKDVLKYWFIIPVLYHMHRYYKYNDLAREITLQQRELWMWNVLDYLIIGCHIVYKQYTFLLGVISGFLSFFFVYKTKAKGVKKSVKKSVNIFVDIYMVVFMVYILLNTYDLNISFFAIRELTYHLLEFFIFY